MKKLVLVALAVLSSVFFAGCATYRLVGVSVQTDINRDVFSETTKVPDFQQRMEKYKNIVVSLPKDYYDSGTTSASKGISGAEVLLRESHALWITEIEREFLKKGYRVLSRQKYQELLREKKVKTSKEAGALLGADIIVQINSLEYNPKVSIKQKTKADLSFYKSNSKGRKKGIMAVSPKEAKILSDMVSWLVDTSFEPFAYMALLDCKLIDAKTGEIVFFYKTQLLRLKSGREPRMETSYLFRRLDSKWQHLRLPKQGKTAKEKVLTFQIHAQAGGTREASQLIQSEMIRTICSDFASNLRGRGN